MFDKITILLVDNDEQTVRDVKSALVFKGYIVHTASTIIQAKSIIVKESPHLILLNIVLPDETGFRFLRELKGNLMFANIPLIIVSENNSLQERVEGWRSALTIISGNLLIWRSFWRVSAAL